MGHILIIEDEPAIVMVLEEMLSEEGYEISKAYDGITGLKRLSGLPKPDLVLVDLNMPGVKGRDVIETMRSDKNLKDIPAIIITGTVYNSVDFPPMGSYQDVLEKPFELMDLLQKVKELVKTA